ncbi:MAG: hypothetical protein PHI12_08435 [Dehalococcoidales bacterium]|nr:hypothetical protein [Dehalococcoidales bacterium]
MKTEQIQANGKIKVSLRDIALMFARHIPESCKVDMAETTESYLHQIKYLSANQRIAIRSAYIFASKAPSEERQDLFQELVSTLLTKTTPDERLSYAMAKCDWVDWWRKYTTRSHMARLDAPVKQADNEPESASAELSELLVGEMEFESKICAKLDAQRILDIIPKNIKSIGVKRMLGQALNANDRQVLCRWIKNNPMVLESMQA